MIKNFLKLSVRNLWENRFFTSLNLFGLAIGLAVSLALTLFIKEELSFDQYHKNVDRIFRINLDVSYDDKDQKWAKAPNIAGPAFKEGIEEVEEYTRFLLHNFGRTAFVRTGEKNFAERYFYWADNGLFRIFDVDLLQGDPATALVVPNKVILSRSTAQKMFGDQNPLGQTLKVDNSLDLQVTGVYEDFPDNSSLDCELIGSFVSLDWASKELYWSNCSYETYLLLRQGSDAKKVQQQMLAIQDQAVAKADQWFTTWLQPFADIHLFSQGIEKSYVSRAGSVEQVRLLGALALMVLVLACFNYINMSTARSQQRFREVGISKTLGATNGLLVSRFFVETGLLVGLALIIGVMTVQLCAAWLQPLSGKMLDVFDFVTSPWGLALPLIWFIVTLGAGFYPALFLSSFSPKKLLQSNAKGKSGKSFFRHTLVAGQFGVCVALVFGAIVFQRQLSYISQKNLGYSPQQVVAVTTAGAENTEQIEALMNAYSSLPFVHSLCRAMSFPGVQPAGYSMTRPNEPDITAPVGVSRVTQGFEQVLDLKFIAGRTLPVKLPNDTTAEVVINERAAKFLGYTPDEAIGKTPPNLFQWPTTIVGVVEDFHFESLHQPIGAFAFSNANRLGWRPYLLVKLNTENLQGIMAQLETNFKKYVPTSAFEYTFLDEHLGRLYEQEKRLSKVIMAFTLLAIFISCLGLFGLVAFTAERRTKEIGIRKVLGASLGGLVGLLAKDFLKPVLIAIVFAVPLSWWAMDRWLQKFAYHAGIQWWIFLLAGGLALLIAFLTVSFQSVKSALANPVESLRNE